MGEYSVKCLGVGDGLACVGRGHSAFLYRLGDTTLLLDAGEPVSASYKAGGHPPDLVDAIVLSHRHFDHIGGLFMLIQGWWIERRTRGLDVHMPTYGMEPMKELLQNSLFIEEQLRFRMDFKTMVGGNPTLIKGAKITPFHTTHMNRLQAAMPDMAPAAFECFCFLIEAEGLRIGHSADLGAPEDLEPLLREPLDLLVCELAHFEPEALFGYLKGRKIKRLALVHLGGDFWEMRDTILAQAQAELPGVDVCIPNDGDVIGV